MIDLSDEERAVVSQIRSWRRFHYRVRRSGSELLAAIGRYSGCVLVAGCQRSGTTMLTRIVAGASGFTRFRFTHDDELDAALVLGNRIALPAQHRYCFQTTYLNEAFPEYGKLTDDQKLVWVLRNPYSVVYSMVYQWKRFALNELYESAAAGCSNSSLRETPWQIGLRKIRRACVAYAWKTRQIHKIRNLIPASRLRVVDYHDLVCDPALSLREIFDFINEPFLPEYARTVKADSLAKADRLSLRERALIDEIALPAYEECRSLISPAQRPK